MFKKTLNYKINQKNKELFLEKTEKHIRPAMKILLDNIIHVSHDEFIEKIKKQVDSLNSYIILNIIPNRPIFFYLKENDNNKSNYYVYTYIKKFLEEKDNNIKIDTVSNIEDEKLQENDIILFVDDCIYRGFQMTTNINRFLFKYKYIEDIKDNKVKNIKLSLVVPYISKESLKDIKNIFEKRNNIKFNVIDHIPIDRADKYLNKEYYELHKININKDITIDTILDYYPYISNIDSKPYLIYFDHKVADNVSTFPYILNGLVPNENNKKIIENIQILKRIHIYNELNIYDNNKITRQDKNTQINKINKQLIKDTEEEEEKLDFFPLLTNCEHIKKTISNESLCPIPPYKEEYETLKSKNKIILLQELINNHFQKIHDLINIK